MGLVGVVSKNEESQKSRDKARRQEHHEHGRNRPD